MNIVLTELEGVYVFEPHVYKDNRGWFMESYCKSELLKYGIDLTFVQDNHSFSAYKGTIRGFHFQAPPKAQTKLVRCTRGAIRDVVVDIRRGSKDYKKWIAIELSEENKKQILIPKGYAHAFITLTDNVEVEYKVDEYYSKEHDKSIYYNDPSIGVDWNELNPIISDKDRYAPYLADYEDGLFYLHGEMI